MPWTTRTILKTSDTSPGFVQAIDFSAAWGWQDELLRLLEAGPGATWEVQYRALCGMVRGLSGLYRSCNLRWYVDPVAADIYREWVGQYEPKDPDASCRRTEQGPGSVWTRGAERFHNRAGVKRTPAQLRACDSDGSCAEPRLVRRVRELIARARPDLSTRPLVCVVPFALAYKSEAICVNLANRSAGEPASRFDGLFAGLLCDGREVPQDQWQWSCVRFDDAPANDVRASLPCDGVWEWLSAWARRCIDRDPVDIVTDARVHEVLANIERAEEAGLTRASELDTAWYQWLKAANASPWSSSGARSGLQTGATIACGVASAAGGIPGLVCAAFAAGADALFSLLPADAWAYGCDFDGFGRTKPSPLSAQIDRVNLPPDFSAPTPPQPALLRVARDAAPLVMPIPYRTVADASAAAQNNAEKVKVEKSKTIPPASESDMGEGVVVGGAALVLLWLLARRGKR